MARSKTARRATHAELKRLALLLRDKNAREQQGLFVGEGPRVVEAALHARAPVTTIYVVDAGSELAQQARAARVDVLTMSETDVVRVGATRTPQPAFALIEMRPAPLDALTSASLSVACVQVNDPGNAGTLLRSAAAAGATAVGFCAGSVDAYNPKVIRASAGACFGIAAVEGPSAAELLDALGNAGVQRLGAVPRGGRAPEAFDCAKPTAFVLGHETRGLSADLPLDGLVTIPITSGESLNVAMAGTALLFEAARQRRAT